MARSFQQLVTKKWKEGKFFCLALDTDFDRISPAIRSYVAGMSKLPLEILSNFNRAVINESADLVAAYSFNLSVYMAYANHGGIEALINSISHIAHNAPDVPVILEAPINLGDRVNDKLIANLAFKELSVDAVVVSPFPGEKTLKSLLASKHKGIIVLCLSDQESGNEFQDVTAYSLPERLVELFNGPARSLGRDISVLPNSMPLYQYVAHRVANHWNISENCWLGFYMSGADEIARTRRIAEELPFFVKADPNESLRSLIRACRDRNGEGFLIAMPDIVFSTDATNFRSKIVQEIDAINKNIKEIMA